MKQLYILILALWVATSFFAQTPVASINTLPAPVNGTITLCQGQSINFASSSTGTTTGTSFNWNFGNGSPATATNPGPHSVMFNTASAGQLISLTVSNPNGLQSTATFNVIVQAVPASQMTLASSVVVLEHKY